MIRWHSLSDNQPKTGSLQYRICTTVKVDTVGFEPTTSAITLFNPIRGYPSDAKTIIINISNIFQEYEGNVGKEILKTILSIPLLEYAYIS